jgi:hypothetical protein
MSPVLASVALYAGGAATVAGAAMLLRRRTRRAGGALIAGGLGVAAAALLWPVSESHVASQTTHLDAAMPRWQFHEVHDIHVDADPRHVYDAVRAVRANEIALFKTLVAIRRGGRKGPEDILNPPEDAPLLDVATRTTFHYLANDPPREIVVGTCVGPGVDATMNFLIAAEGRGCRLTTETRVFADNARGARIFAGYWRAIHPGSDLIRRMWLRAIKHRAEA